MGDDLVAVEVVKGAVEQPGQDVHADLVEGGRVPGAAGGVGQQVDPLDCGLRLGGGQAAGAEHGGAVLVQPGAHRPVAQRLVVAALVVPGIDGRHQATQPGDELAGVSRPASGSRTAQTVAIWAREPGQMVGEDAHLGSVDVAGEEGRVYPGKVVHELLGEVALPVRRAPGPGQGGADLVCGIGHRVVEPVYGVVVEGGSGPPDLGDDAEQPGGFVVGLPGLCGQQRQQFVVGHAGDIDSGQGGGQSLAGRDARQGREAVHHRDHTQSSHSTSSITTMPRTYIRPPTVLGTRRSERRAATSRSAPSLRPFLSEEPSTHADVRPLGPGRGVQGRAGARWRSGGVPGRGCRRRSSAAWSRVSS